MRREKIQDITYVALCTAVLAVISQLAIPVGVVPLTLQTYAVALIGYFLGLRRGLITVGIYIALGALGAPVFAGFGAGMGVLLGYTGGFIFGYIPYVLLTSIKGTRVSRIANGTVGLLLCHTAGAIQYMLLSSLDFVTAIMAVSVPFLLKDIILTVLAFFTSEAIKKRI